MRKVRRVSNSHQERRFSLSSIRAPASTVIRSFVTSARTMDVADDGASTVPETWP